MVNDQEPRYRLVDSNGNVVGSLFQNADGNVEIQDETGTGSVFGPDGIVTPAIDAESASVESLDSRQGYTDVASSRSLDTQETNNTGSDLDVAVTVISDADATDINARINVDGVRVDAHRRTADEFERVSYQATIPNGSTYIVEALGDTANYSLVEWVEQQ